MVSEKQYLIALYAFIPFGPARLTLLKNYFKSYKDVWNATTKDLLNVGLNRSIVESFNKYKSNFDFDKFFANLDKNNINTLTFEDKDYPPNLADLDDAPLVLYVRGEIKLSDTNAVAIVGSRKMTSYGRDVTEKLSSQLAAYGVTIVSGLAFGVDVAAHKAAVEVSGRCIAVLASGVDVVTPRSNDWLGKRILKIGGALVSEYPPGTDPQRSFFPFRNRIISGLSKAVVVIEGMEKSGTIHTANHAAKQGREVFAVPGQITSPMSQAPHFLIKNGAKMVTDVSDILNELNMQLKVDKDLVEKIMPSDKTEEMIIETLQNEKMHLDEIARSLKLSVNEVSAKLTMMELKGMVRNMGNGEYGKN